MKRQRPGSNSIAHLVLEAGTILPGKPFGAVAGAVFELVFTTSVTGYQEIITDPSYRGQGVLFTVPHYQVDMPASTRPRSRSSISA